MSGNERAGRAKKERARRGAIGRRAVLGGLAGLAGFASLAGPSGGGRARAAPSPLLHRSVPRTGARVPAVGLGSWITFNVGRDPELLASSAAVIEAFLAAGGTVIDSSPMYGSAQATIGRALGARPGAAVFEADKVWTPRGEVAAEQVARTQALWGRAPLALLQVHNLVDWEAHLPMLLDMRERGMVGHVGVTTSHGRRHDELERVMAGWPLDFVQLTYNPVDRAAEGRLLPLARERGQVVIVNRPFRGGSLPRALTRTPLPGFAGEIGAADWAQLILKFILSHEAETLPIPATTVPAHATENVDAARGALPDDAMRLAIVEAIRSA